MALRVTFFLNLKKRSQEFLLSVSLNLTTVKPPVSDHLKWEALVVAYGRWPFTRVETQGFFSKKRSRSGHIHIICIQFLSCNMCNQCFREKSNFTAVAECR